MKAISQNPRHILIIPSWYFDKGSEGIFIHEHARMTAEVGYQVGLIYVRRAPFWKSSTETFYQIDQISIGIAQTFYPPKVIWAISLWKCKYCQLFRKYAEKYGKPDIIHAHGYVAGIAARHLSIHTSIPYVITEHNSSIPAGKVMWYHAAELRHTYRDAKTLIAVSAYLKRAMQQWARKKEIIVIHNPIDLRRFQGITGRNNLVGKQLIAIGALEPGKNFNILLDALAIVHRVIPVRLKLIGSGSELKTLRKHASDLGVLSQIEWFHLLSSAEVAKQLLQSDVLISSSGLETFGVVIVEALACGIPVVVAQSGAPEEYLDESVARIVPVNDADALASAIRYVLDHPDEFNAEEIRAFAEKNFDFPVIGAQIDALYQRILNKVT